MEKQVFEKRILDTRNVILILGMTLLILFYIGYLIFGIQTKITGGVDYLAHYSAGYIMRYEKAGEVFNLDLQKTVQDRIFTPDDSARFYPYNHPPILLGILGWVTNTDYVMSYFRWLLALLVFHLLSLVLLLRLMRFVDWGPSLDLRIFFMTSFMFYPAFLAYCMPALTFSRRERGDSLPHRGKGWG